MYFQSINWQLQRIITYRKESKILAINWIINVKTSKIKDDLRLKETVLRDCRSCFFIIEINTVPSGTVLNGFAKIFAKIFLITVCPRSRWLYTNIEFRTLKSNIFGDTFFAKLFQPVHKGPRTDIGVHNCVAWSIDIRRLSNKVANFRHPCDNEG